jgi:hypothetical protein
MVRKNIRVNQGIEVFMIAIRCIKLLTIGTIII